MKLPRPSRIAPALWLGPTALYPICREHQLGMAELVDRAANTGNSSHGAFAGNVERRVERLGWER